MKIKRNSIIWIVIIITIIFGFIIVLNDTNMKHYSDKLSVLYNKEIVNRKDKEIYDLLDKWRYKCCMEKPCFRCFSKPWHQDEEMVCDCLIDVMNGKAPCGECLGEILEWAGNSLISEYFATAIANKLWKQHLETLKQIIFEQYNIPVDKQI